MNDEAQKLKRLSEALEDHSIEGVALLSAEPSKLIRTFIILMTLLIIVGLIWSFIGRADVIVTAPGTVSPDQEVKRFYAPISGELVELFVGEGSLVTHDGVLAKINARGAVEAATNADAAQIRLEEAKRDLDQFPENKILLEGQASGLEKEIEILEKEHEKRLMEDLDKVAADQQAKLDVARSNLQLAKRLYSKAAKELKSSKRLAEAGAIPKATVDEKYAALHAAQAEVTKAKARFDELDTFLSDSYAKARTRLEGSDIELNQKKIQLRELKNKIMLEQSKVQNAFRRAQIQADAASRINFKNIDENNFLEILAPVSGVITEIAFTQAGDKISANTPLGGIAPKDSRVVVKIEINESDRAFLKLGQPVKIKFNAFPYQRYGFIDGKLEHISPSTQLSQKTKTLVYKGRVGLDRDYFSIDGEEFQLRYGMEAVTEIIVRKRRIVDLALDPFRQIAG